MVSGIRVAVVSVFVAVTVGVAATQQGPHVTITSPTALPAFTAGTSKVTLMGLARSNGSSPVKTVTWRSDRGGSGMATYDPHTSIWVTANPIHEPAVPENDSGSAPIAGLDDLQAAAFEQVWDEAATTLPSTVAFVQRGDGHVQINTSAADTEMPYIINTVEPFPIIEQTSYDVAVTLANVSGGDDDGAALIFGYQDESNYCAVFWYGARAQTDLYLLKRSDGTLETLGDPADVDPATGDVVAVAVRGEDLDVTVNGVSRITAADGDCDDADTVGLGVGALRDVPTDDAVTSWHFDAFVVKQHDDEEYAEDENTEANESANGAVTLHPGTNVITVLATDAAGGTSTDTITITRATGSDTGAPTVNFTAPANASSHVISTLGTELVVSAVDDTAVIGCTFTCATCVPAGGTLAATATAEGGTWSAPAVSLSVGANTVKVTCVDAAGNEGRDTLTVTRTTNGGPAPPSGSPPPGGDAAAPFITVPANFSSPSTPARITGTAHDNVSVSRVRWTCDRCPPGEAVFTEGPSVSWTATVPLVPGANVVTFIAEDDQGNRSSDPVTVTYHASLTILTSALGSAKQGIAYGPSGAGVILSAAGASPPFVWDNNAGGSSLGSGACRGLSVTPGGVVAGTPTAVGTCVFTVRVRAGGSDSDVRSFTIQVRDPRASGPHDYFDDLIARADCFKALSLRPQAGYAHTGSCEQTAHYTSQLQRPRANGYAVSNDPARRLQVTYDFDNDADPQRQDAAKVTLPAWDELAGVTLGAPLSANDVTMTVTPCTKSVANGKAFKIEDEIVVSTSPAGKVCTFPIARAQFGTPRGNHGAGTPVHVSLNSIENQVRFPIQTDGTERATYLFTWDAFWTDSYVGLEKVEHKAFMLSNWSGGTQFWETQTRFPVSAAPQHEFNRKTDVATVMARNYNPFVPPVTRKDPVLPMANPPFVIEPNKWLRFWVLVEANPEGEADAFQDVTTLAASVDSTSATSLVIHHPTSLAGAPFTDAKIRGGSRGTGSWPGRSLRIGSEIMTISGCTVCTGLKRTLTVQRGQFGTKAQTHPTGAAVQLVSDYVTMYVADEDTDAVLLYGRMPVTLNLNASSETARGSMAQWWIEFNTSTGDADRGRAAKHFRDLVAYVRNFVMLKNAVRVTDPDTRLPDWSALRVRPMR